MKKFTPKLVYFDKVSYDKECKVAESKLNLLEDARQNALKIVKNVELFEFEKDFISYVEKQAIKEATHLHKLKLSDDKLIYLLELDTSDLKDLQIQYEQIAINVNWIDKTPSITVDKEKYSRWTKSEFDNEKLQAIQDFIQSVKEIRKYSRITIGNLPQVTSNLVKANFREMKLEVNHTLF